ncbi:hypothetical protein [Thauera sp. WH-1]|uniref:hypothetical protein n=1 Tax=Thauera sp. WH-1 TaxID=3398230 RepID=UPI0039FD4EB2
MRATRTLVTALLAAALASAAAGCASGRGDAGQAGAESMSLTGPVAGAIGLALMASELDLFEPEYIAGALVAFAIYDPLAPTWRIDVTDVGGDRLRMDLRMKALATGGEGEARQVFLRNARQVVERGGFAGFDVLRFEEGVESTRPFARRYASGEIRLVRSGIFPEL